MKRPAPNRAGFVRLEPLIYVVWIGIAAAMLVPMLTEARALAGAEGLALGAAYWATLKTHWIQSTIGVVALLIPLGMVLLDALDSWSYRRKAKAAARETSGSPEEGFVRSELLPVLIWLGIPLMLFLPLFGEASNLGRTQSLTLGSALWITMKAHWIRSALGVLLLAAPPLLIVADVIRESVHRRQAAEERDQDLNPTQT
jgi:hypothetical protein